MDTPKRIPDGQVDQQNMEVQGVESNPTQAPTGAPLEMKITDGKAGTTESVGLPQTDFTDHPGGPGIHHSAEDL